MRMVLSALAGALALASCAPSGRETFAEPKSASQPAAATDHGVDIPTDMPAAPEPRPR